MEGNSLSLDGKDAEQDERGEGSYENWQKTRIQHQGAVINLVLTLTIAAMGFGADLLFKKEGETILLGTGARWFVLGSLAVFVVSVVCGLWVNLSRLWDFRWTARAARLTTIRLAYEPISLKRESGAGTGCAERSYSKGQRPRSFPQPASWVYDLMTHEAQRIAGRSSDAEASRTTLWRWFHEGTWKKFKNDDLEKCVGSLKDDVETLRKDSMERRLRRLKALGVEVQPFGSPLNPRSRKLRQGRIAYNLAILRDRCRARASRFGELTSKLFGWQLVTFLLGVSVLATGMLVHSLSIDESENRKEKKLDDRLSSLDRKVGEVQQQQTVLRQDYDVLYKRLQGAPMPPPVSSRKLTK